MKYKVTFDCGKNTCCNENGKICWYVGNEFLCGLFDNVELRERDGRLMRCAVCRDISQVDGDGTSPGHDDLLAACDLLADAIVEGPIDKRARPCGEAATYLWTLRVAIAGAKGIEP